MSRPENFKKNEKAKYFLNQHWATTIVSTADKQGKPRAALFASLTMIDNSTIIMACSDFQKTYKNLKENPYAHFLVIGLGRDYLDYEGVDGVRVIAKLAKDKKDGAYFKLFQKKMSSIGYKMTNYLVFKVIEIHSLAFMPRIENNKDK
ncbi:pyridoxamine 5'-phosphate oxidase family protein [Patescibacteria group bacterium]|nr:pyridoxamine 5'-phosphate oxidase family protein [Patescibacteria group bacterium]